MNAQQDIQSGLAMFAPRARLLRIIGAELISDDVVAVTELVKNAHDADASFVSIQFINAAGADGEIHIRDDGHGMHLDTLLTRWMQPAGSAKGREGTRFTPGGRRVLGEKGVGRFAADKLAARLELVSRRQAEPSEVHAVFDWDEFDADDRMLSDVASRWQVRPADWLDTQGTMLRLTRLRARWTERMFRRLCTRLARLVSPFDARAGFRILVESDEFPDYSGEVPAGYLDVAPYKIEATFDGKSTVMMRKNGGRQSRFSLPEAAQLRCGPVRARLFAFDLETEALARLGPRAEVRAWLREWSGISVYRDGFRIWPYGEPHDDWLRLDQRRVNNPVVKLSNNQVVGFVEVTGDQNQQLRDQTSREGLLHNDAFEDLQRFVLNMMQVLEGERQAVRHPQGRRGGERKETRPARESASLPDLLDRLAKKAKGPLSEDLRRASTRARASLAFEAESRRKMLDGYTDLAAAGQTASLVGRSVAACLEDVQAVCSGLRQSFGKAGERNADDLVATAAAINKLEATVTAASAHLNAVSAMHANSSKRRRGLDVAAELERFRALSVALLADHDAELRIDATSGAVLRTEMRPEMFGAVISALVTNSLEWTHRGRPLRIVATVRTHDDDVTLTVSDNGRGVTPGFEETIFEPMVSARSDGAGMGLTIARSIVEKHGGTIAVLTDRRRRGATFTIKLPRKKSRATARS